MRIDKTSRHHIRPSGRVAMAMTAGVLLAMVAGTCGASVASATASGTSRTSTVTLHVAYWSGYNPPGTNIMPPWLHAAETDLRKEYPHVTVVGDEITTNSESEYYSKLDLTERNASTAPDVVFEDSFLIGSDASAGFLRPLPQLLTWSGWSHYFPPMQTIVDYKGQVYGAMNSTDVQIVYYSRKLFKEAGLPTNWQPRSWADVLAAARAIKAHDAGAVPLWVYTGQAVGEPASTQGFQVFLDGTNDRLYDDSTQKWEISGPGFTATWNLLQRMRPYEEPESDWSNPQAEATLALTLIPAQQVGIVFEGNWIATAYIPGGLHPWKGFYTQYGEARIPTENGQAPGFDTLSGGWALSVPRLAAHPKISLAFIEAASSAKRLAPFDVTSGSLPPRSDVLDLPVWQDATKVNPVIGFSTALLPHTNCRPDLPVYVQVSNELQQLTGEISMGSITGAQAAAQYASAITKIVGAGDVEHRNK